MSNQELEKYIQEARDFGLDDAEVKKRLIQVGWDEPSIKEAFQSLATMKGDTDAGVSQVTNPHPLSQANNQTLIQPKPLSEHGIGNGPVETSPKIASTTSVIKGNPLTKLKGLFSKKLLLLLIPVVVFFFAGSYYVAGMGKTPLGEKLQDHFWTSYIESIGTKPVTQKTTYIYQDHGQFNFVPSDITKKIAIAIGQDTTAYGLDEDLKELDKVLSFNLIDPKVALNIDGYINIADAAKPAFDLNTSFTAGNQGNDYTVSLGTKLNTEALFLKYGYDAKIKKIIDELAKQEFPDPYKDKWLKFALGDLSEGAPTVTQDTSFVLDALKKHRMLKIKYMSGVSMLDGQLVLKYELDFDKEQFKQYYFELLNSSGSIYGSLAADERVIVENIVNKITDSILAKIEVKEFTAYVGLFDGEVYKYIWHSNAPSVTGFLNSLVNDLPTTLKTVIDASLDEAQSKARDAKRFAEARQMATALELYYNDYNVYPKGDSQGRPIGLNSYIGSLPVEPTPADGKCTDFYNKYWYSSVGGNDYQYTFCVGAKVGEFEAGNYKVTPAGIIPFTDCGSSRPCYEATSRTIGGKTDKELQELVVNGMVDFIQKIPMTAEISIHTESSDWGKSKEVVPPADAVDILSSEYNYSLNTPVTFIGSVLGAMTSR